MEEEEEDREGGGLVGMDSMESRWVFQDEEETEIDDDEDDGDNEGNDAGQHAGAADSEDDDNAEQRLVRTGPRIDSFDVEALEIPGAHRNDYDEVLFFGKAV